MYTCAQCSGHACRSGDLEHLPKNCPMRDPDFFEKILDEYAKPENHDFFVTSAAIEALGYCQWPRLREVVEFSRRMGYHRLGMAFCVGLHREAAIVDRLLREQGFEVVSVACKTGAIPKQKLGIDKSCLSDDPDFVPSPTQERLLNSNSCDPIAQAELLNRAETEFNICLGLCVGHDSLFYKYAKAPVTTLVAKDRVTGHNPAAAIYCADSYFKTRNGAE